MTQNARFIADHHADMRPDVAATDVMEEARAALAALAPLQGRSHAGACADVSADPRIAARIARYAARGAGQATDMSQNGTARRPQSPAATSVGAEGCRAESAGLTAAASRQAAHAAMDGVLRHEWQAQIGDLVSAAVRRALSGERAGARLQERPELVAALDRMPAAVAAELKGQIDLRLDAVDDHLSDLTSTLAAHPAWRMGDGLGRMEARLGALAEMLDRMASDRINDERLRALLHDALATAPQPATRPAPDVSALVTRPVLEAINDAAERIAGLVSMAAHASPTPVQAAGDAQAQTEVAEALRSELADAAAGQSRNIARVENRLSALQDSVAALTEQLRADREAAEEADRLAHARAMSVIATPAPETLAQAGQPSSQPAAAATMAMPRVAQLGDTPAAAAPSTAEVRSRFIASARRASGNAIDNPRTPASGARRPAAGGRSPRAAVSGWLKGKGLLWVAAAVVAGGAAPLLAPVLRAVPAAMLPTADMGVSPAQAAPAKIGSQLTTTEPGRPGSIMNDPAALHALADRLAEGANIGSPRLVSNLLEKAAERGQAPAQYRLARLYEKGAGVEQDAVKAQQWYARAAERGNVRAMHNLAVMFADGALGQPDYAAALRWFRQAADRGLGDSQYNLGVLLARGLGGPANPAEAWRWFDIAARAGDAEAAARRDEVAASLSSAALAAARDAASRWRAAPSDAQANDIPTAASRQAGEPTRHSRQPA